MQGLTQGDQITLDTDIWEDVGKVYSIEKAVYIENSTAVELTFDDGQKRVVSENVIRKVQNDN